MYVWKVYKKVHNLLTEHRCCECGRRVLESDFFGKTICMYCADAETKERIRIKIQAQLVKYRKRR